MGGNVFKSETGEPLNRRYSKAEYLDLIEELTPEFNSIFSKFNVCSALNEKQSFGDIDVVGVPAKELSISLLKHVFDTTYCMRNGTTYSLLYKHFQIDLIISNDLEYEFTKNYQGLADRANFVGKVAHQLGLKFGHDGLFLLVRSSDSHILGEICLTRDPIRAEEFLDIKPLKSADTFQEVFDNIAVSKYFNPEVFDLENNNAIARVRDKKRPYYRKFLELCSALPKKEYFPRSKDKDQYLQLFFNAFPNAHKEYRILHACKEKADALKLIFNGNIVSELTGLKNQELGEFMISFKIFYTDTIILDIGATKIQECIRQFKMKRDEECTKTQNQIN